MVLVFSEDSGGKYNQKNLSNKKNLLFFDKFPVTASGRGAAGEPVADVAAELLAGRWRILRRFVSQHSRRSAKVPGRTLCRACRRVGADVAAELSECRGQSLRQGCRRAGAVAAGMSVPHRGGPAGAPGWMLRRSFSGGCSVRRRPVFAVFAVSPDADARKAPRHAAEPAFLPIFAHIWQ